MASAPLMGSASHMQGHLRACHRCPLLACSDVKTCTTTALLIATALSMTCGNPMSHPVCFPLLLSLVQSSVLFANNTSKFLTSIGPFSTGSKNVFHVGPAVVPADNGPPCITGRHV
jgi:hypothetical protein